MMLTFLLAAVDGVTVENVRLGKARKGNRIENAVNVKVIPE